MKDSAERDKGPHARSRLVRRNQKSTTTSARRRAYVGNTSYVVYVRYVVANYTGASRELHLYMLHDTTVAVCHAVCSRDAYRARRGTVPATTGCARRVTRPTEAGGAPRRGGTAAGTVALDVPERLDLDLRPW